MIFKWLFRRFCWHEWNVDRVVDDKFPDGGKIKIWVMKCETCGKEDVTLQRVSGGSGTAMVMEDGWSLPKKRRPWL